MQNTECFMFDRKVKDVHVCNISESSKAYEVSYGLLDSTSPRSVLRWYEPYDVAEAIGYKGAKGYRFVLDAAGDSLRPTHAIVGSYRKLGTTALEQITAQLTDFEQAVTESSALQIAYDGTFASSEARIESFALYQTSGSKARADANFMTQFGMSAEELLGKMDKVAIFGEDGGFPRR